MELTAAVLPKLSFLEFANSSVKLYQPCEEKPQGAVSISIPKSFSIMAGILLDQ
jgi:hypothetical protein